jgi:phage terminase small subunit
MTKGQISHLSAEMQAFCRSVTRRWSLNVHHEALLVKAAEAHDRGEQAKTLLSEQGLTTIAKSGEIRPHPAVAIERDSRTAFARLIRELGLSNDVADNRPPRLAGRYAGRD